MKKQRKKNNLKRTPIVMPEYYQLVFIQLHETFSMAIHKRYVLNPSEFRRTLLLNIRCDFIESSEVQQYSMLMKTLDDLECELKRIIESVITMILVGLKKYIALWYLHIQNGFGLPRNLCGPHVINFRE